LVNARAGDGLLSLALFFASTRVIPNNAAIGETGCGLERYCGITKTLRLSPDGKFAFVTTTAAESVMDQIHFSRWCVRVRLS
jgi:hypothetical protein